MLFYPMEVLSAFLVLLCTVQCAQARIFATTSHFPMTFYEVDITTGKGSVVFNFPNTLADGLYYQTATMPTGSPGSAVAGNYSFFVNSREGLHLATLSLEAGGSSPTLSTSPTNVLWAETHQPEAITWVQDPKLGRIIFTVSFWDTPKDPRPRSIRRVIPGAWTANDTFLWPEPTTTKFEIGVAAHDKEKGLIYYFLTNTTRGHYMHVANTANPFDAPVLRSVQAVPDADGFPIDYVFHPTERVLWAITTYNFAPGLVKVDPSTGVSTAASTRTFGTKEWIPAESTKPVIDRDTGLLVTTYNVNSTEYLVSLDSSGSVVHKVPLDTSVKGLSSIGSL